MSNKVEEKEIWKQYPDYDFIEVSNLGRVRTKDRTVMRNNGTKQFIKGRILKQRLRPDGYVDIQFSVNGKPVKLYVHRMIAITYIPNPDNLSEVNHIDCNRANNRADNLEWCAREYNIVYREKYGTACNRPVFAINLKTGKVMRFESQSEAARQLGVDVENLNSVVKGRANQTGDYWFTEDESEITEEKIREIKVSAHLFGGVIAVDLDNLDVLWFKSQSEAARQLGIDVRRINMIIKGRRNKTGNYWFCYADENAVEKTRVKFGDEIARKVEELMKNK